MNDEGGITMSNDISVVTSKVPAHVKEGSKLGNENVSSEHISVPRVKLLQKMNNEVDETTVNILMALKKATS